MTIEPGIRVQGGHSPFLMRLDDGRIRMYYNRGSLSESPGGIFSAISTDDGTTFTAEGVRITAGAVGFPALTNPSIVRVGGIWRAYFSDSDVSRPFIQHAIKSATSTDLLNWTVESGVRIGAGATLTGSAAHPSAVANNDGSVTLYYGREGQVGESAFFLWAATSEDGVNFPTEVQLETLGKGGDPNVVRVGGALRMYYNWGDASSGTIYSASSVTGAPLLFRDPVGRR